jgi:hypothetical protein
MTDYVLKVLQLPPQGPGDVIEVKIFFELCFGQGVNRIEAVGE